MVEEKRELEEQEHTLALPKKEAKPKEKKKVKKKGK